MWRSVQAGSKLGRHWALRAQHIWLTPWQSREAYVGRSGNGWQHKRHTILTGPQQQTRSAASSWNPTRNHWQTTSPASPTFSAATLTYFLTLYISPSKKWALWKCTTQWYRKSLITPQKCYHTAILWKHSSWHSVLQTKLLVRKMSPKTIGLSYVQFIFTQRNSVYRQKLIEILILFPLKILESQWHSR